MGVSGAHSGNRLKKQCEEELVLALDFERQIPFIAYLN